ncbi:MAG TPA: hypothetical protein VGM29_15240 [Polyangiaceae bacterium]|jgi:hypothetical protein
MQSAFVAALVFSACGGGGGSIDATAGSDADSSGSADAATPGPHVSSVDASPTATGNGMYSLELSFVFSDTVNVTHYDLECAEVSGSGSGSGSNPTFVGSGTLDPVIPSGAATVALVVSAVSNAEYSCMFTLTDVDGLTCPAFDILIAFD